MNYDICIVGGGIVGKALACMLARQSSLSIALFEAENPNYHWSNDHYHYRVSAISLSSKRILQAIDIWNNIKIKRISPFTQIQVWDAEGTQSIHFDSKSIAELTLGYIVENNVIQLALDEKIKHYPSIKSFSPVTLSNLEQLHEMICLTTTNGESIFAKLVVGADGAHSWLRTQSKMAHSSHDYEQIALVSTVSTSLPHDKTARQVFLKTGPLAFLPLAEPRSASIVWTLPQKEAQTILQLEDDLFKEELAKAFSHRLGEIVTVDKRYSFPLYKQQIEHYVASRRAFVGDAAQVVHPLAGQGLNIGLLDAASLAEVIVDADNKQRDIGSLQILNRYDRWRKADNYTMLKGIDLLKNVFENNKKSFLNARWFGMKFINRTDWIKNLFIRYAVGNRNGLPHIATVEFLNEK